MMKTRKKKTKPFSTLALTKGDRVIPVSFLFGNSMIKFYKSKHTFKRRTHEDVPGWGQAVMQFKCPVCDGKASGYIIEHEPLRGSCSECYVRFVQLKKTWHVFVPKFKIEMVERLHGKINWVKSAKSPFTKARKYDIIHVNPTIVHKGERSMAFTTKVTLSFSDGEVAENFKADDKKVSTRNARRWIRNQGFSIRDAEKEEKGKTQLIVAIASDEPMPQPEAVEDDNDESES
jgi:hypothetical protein